MALRMVIIGNMESLSTMDHDKTSNRNIADQHIITSITGLRSELDDIIQIGAQNAQDIQSMKEVEAPITTTTYTYETCQYDISRKRVKTVVVTGDISRTITYTYDDLDRVVNESIEQDGVTKTKVITYLNDEINTIVDNGTELLNIHKLDSRRIFNMDNIQEKILTHNLGTKYLHVTVWKDDVDYSKDCAIQVLDINSVKVTAPLAITAIVVIS